MLGFEYAAEPHTRRHGPQGYRDYESYRDWLRDEFTFRCVYCLHREQWYGRPGTFHIEHFLPVAVHPQGECDYSNLLYACTACNEAKGDALGVPDPCKVALADCLRIQPDGRFEPLNHDGRSLVLRLRLNRQTMVGERCRWIRALKTLRLADPNLYHDYMGFPEDLPDLRQKRPPANTKPQGAENCYFVLRERGELPAAY